MRQFHLNLTILDGLKILADAAVVNLPPGESLPHGTVGWTKLIAFGRRASC